MTQIITKLWEQKAVFSLHDIVGFATISARKDLPLKTQIAFIRRKMAEQGITGKEKRTLKRVVPLRELEIRLI